MTIHELEKHLSNYFKNIKKSDADMVQVHDLDFSKIYADHPDLSPDRLKILAIDAGLILVNSVDDAKTLPHGQAATYLVIREDKQVVETGEPDQDYDHEAYDSIVKSLKKYGYEAKHKEFDKYQGVKLTVTKDGHKVDDFWTKDVVVRGKVKKNGPKYAKAYLINKDGEKSSATRGDYFMKKDNYVFKGETLVLVDQKGKEEKIENPKKSDLPDLLDVGFPGFEGKPSEVMIMQGEKKDGEFEVEISKGKADVVQLVDYLESLKEVSESLIQEREGSGLAESYPELDEKIWEAVSDAWEAVSRKYELFGGTEAEKGHIEEIEHKSRSGFISHNDGGYQGNGFTTIGYMVGSGIQGSLPTKANEKVEEYYEDGMRQALTQFREQYADEIKDIPEDKLNYHDLYEIGKGNLAEKLSEFESENNTDEQSTVMFSLIAMYNNGGSDGVHTFTIQGVVNWEAPYHRNKSQFEDYYEAEVDFTEEDIKKDLNGVVEKVKAELKKAKEHLGA